MTTETLQPPVEPQTLAQDMADSVPWSDWTRRVISISFIAVVLVGLSVAGPIYGQVVLAIAVCLFLFTPIRALRQRLKMPYTSSVILVFSLYVLSLLLLIILLTAPMARLVADIAGGLDDFLANFTTYLRDYAPGRAIVYDAAGNVVFDLNFIFAPLSEAFNSGNPEDFAEFLPAVSGVVGIAFGISGSLAGLAYNLFFVSVFALLFLLELPRLHHRMIETLSTQSRRQYGVILARFDTTWTGYLWGTAVVAVIGAVTTWLLMTIMGIPNPVGVAAVTTIVLLIPLFGPVLGTVVIFIAALTGGSSALDLNPVALALVASLVFFVIRGVIIGNFVYTRIVGKSIDLPAVTVMIGLAFFGSIGGILGMLLSPVLVALLRDIAVFTLRKLDGKEPFPNAPMPAFMDRDALGAPRFD